MGFFDLIKQVLKRHEPTRISHKDGDVVVMSEEDYDSLIETMELLAQPGFRKKFNKAREEIKQGKTVPFDAYFAKK